MPYGRQGQREGSSVCLLSGKEREELGSRACWRAAHMQEDREPDHASGPGASHMSELSTPSSTGIPRTVKGYK